MSRHPADGDPEPGFPAPSARFAAQREPAEMPSSRLSRAISATPGAGFTRVSASSRTRTGSRPGSPASAGGILPGDVIVGVDAEAVTGIDDIARVLDGTRIEKRVSIHILREERLRTLAVVPTERLAER